MLETPQQTKMTMKHQKGSAFGCCKRSFVKMPRNGSCVLPKRYVVNGLDIVPSCGLCCLTLMLADQAMDMVDAACDQIGKRFLSDRLPPSFSADELAYTSEGPKDSKIWPSTLCRLARPGIARLVLEDGKAVLYHCNENSRVYHEVPLSPMEFEVDDGPALEQLITTVEPLWIQVSDIIHETIEDKIGIAQTLYSEGILAIINPNGDPAGYKSAAME